MEDKKNIWVWIGVAVVIVLVILGIWYVTMQKPAVPAPSGPVPAYAPKGETVPGFPKELILNSAALVNNSYSLNYSSSTNQYTAVWNSSSSITSIADQYQKYFKANGWTNVTMNPVSQPSVRAVFAATTTGYVGVNIATLGKGSQITMTYVAH